MTSPAGNIAPTACPRCRSGEIRSLGKSPVAAVWTIFGCPTCFYAWRSSEPEENVNPDKYPAAFSVAPRRPCRSQDHSSGSAAKISKIRILADTLQ